MTGEKV
jgi:putative transposase